MFFSTLCWAFGVSCILGGFTAFVDPFAESGARYDDAPWVSVLLAIGFWVFGGLIILLAKSLAKVEDP